jgi:hypothetical protein
VARLAEKLAGGTLPKPGIKFSGRKRTRKRNCVRLLHASMYTTFTLTPSTLNAFCWYTLDIAAGMEPDIKTSPHRGENRGTPPPPPALPWPAMRRTGTISTQSPPTIMAAPTHCSQE